VTSDASTLQPAESMIDLLGSPREDFLDAIVEEEDGD